MYNANYRYGYIYLNLWKLSTMGNSGGFNGPITDMVCEVNSDVTNYPC